MKVSVNYLIFSLLLVVVAVSCQTATDKKKVLAVNSDEFANEIKSIQPTQVAEKELPGKAVFTTHCLVCHQADGSGVPGMHPPLGPGSWVGNDPNELIAVMMKGLNGKIEVNGEIYKNFMPSQAQLTDQEIADVLTYIRSSFGNNFDPVKVETVTKIRSGK